MQYRGAVGAGTRQQVTGILINLPFPHRSLMQNYPVISQIDQLSRLCNHDHCIIAE